MSVAHQLALCCVLNSFAYDFIVRNRITGMNLNKFILDETPVLPLYTYVNKGMLSRKVKGWHPNLLDHHPYKQVWLEP